MIDVVEIAKAIVARRHQGVIVPFRSVKIRGTLGESDWSPLPKHCHDNVAAWVSHFPQHKHVFGYAIFDRRRLFGEWVVQAHSVVKLKDGELIDITPSGVSKLPLFVRHEGAHEEFVEMAKAISVSVEAL